MIQAALNRYRYCNRYAATQKRQQPVLGIFTGSDTGKGFPGHILGRNGYDGWSWNCRLREENQRADIESVVDRDPDFFYSNLSFGENQTARLQILRLDYQQTQHFAQAFSVSPQGCRVGGYGRKVRFPDLVAN